MDLAENIISYIKDNSIIVPIVEFTFVDKSDILDLYNELLECCKNSKLHLDNLSVDEAKKWSDEALDLILIEIMEVNIDLYNTLSHVDVNCVFKKMVFDKLFQDYLKNYLK